MRLMEYVLRKFLGPPDCGAWYWHCPVCCHHNPHFRMFTPSEIYKDRTRCHRCRCGGDIIDTLRLFHRLLSFPELKQLVLDLQKEMESRHGKDVESLFPRGDTRSNVEQNRKYATDIVWGEVHGEQLDRLKTTSWYSEDFDWDFLGELCQRCHDEGTTVNDVIVWDDEFEAWCEESDERRRLQDEYDEQVQEIMRSIKRNIQKRGAKK